MKALLIGFSLSLILLACGKGPQKVEPICIQDRVTKFAESDICESGATVNEYKFQGEIVYVFDKGNCGADFTQKVFDDNCTILGYLGGIAGNTQIGDKNFYEKAILKRTIFDN